MASCIIIHVEKKGGHWPRLDPSVREVLWRCRNVSEGVTDTIAHDSNDSTRLKQFLNHCDLIRVKRQILSKFIA